MELMPEKVCFCILDDKASSQLIDKSADFNFSVEMVNEKDILKKLLAENISILVVDSDNPFFSKELIQIYLEINPLLIIVLIGINKSKGIELMDIGCDRFLTKPYDVDEIIKNLEVIHKRFTYTPSDSMNYEDQRTWMLLSDKLQLVTIDNRCVDLTCREAKFVKMLFENQNKVLSKDEVIKNLIGKDLDGVSHRITLMVTRLRNKVLDRSGSVFPIKTVHTVGYVFADKGTICS